MNDFAAFVTAASSVTAAAVMVADYCARQRLRRVLAPSLPRETRVSRKAPKSARRERE